MAVSDTMMGELADRYASALYEAADDAKALDQVESDVESLSALLKGSPELRGMLSNPLIGRDERTKAIVAVAGKADLGTLVTNFLQVLGRNGRLQALGGIAERFLADLRRRRGEITVKVTAAHALSDAQQNTLADAIKGAAGAQVSIDLTVDPELLGGIVVQIGSRLIDASVRTRLTKMHLAMKGPR